MPPGRPTEESSYTYFCHLLSAEKEATETLGDKVAVEPACGDQATVSCEAAVSHRAGDPRL